LAYPIKELYQLERKVTTQLLQLILLEMNMNTTDHVQAMIAKANDKRKVAILEALIEIMSFRQGNKFALGAFVSTIMATKKEEVNWVVWFS
jgi:hypothetical protein